MPTFPLDKDYIATPTPYGHGDGYAMKGTLYYKGKPKEVFEAHGATISAAEEATRAKAEEIWRRSKSKR